MMCPHGHQVAEGARFCPTCGVQVAPAEQPAAQPTGRNRMPLVLGGAAVALVAAAALAVVIAQSGDGEDEPDEAAGLEAAYSACEYEPGNEYVSLEDDGRTILVDTESEYGDADALDCVLTELGTSSSVRARMDRTTALMGVQEASEGGYQYSWSYHPDNGVNMVIEVASGTAGG